MMRRSGALVARLGVAALVGCGLLVLRASPATAQAGSGDGVANKFVQVDGARVHYHDFGGRGVPILFLHSGDLTASTYSDFAPRFTDSYRVIAMTERGVPPSEGARGSHRERGDDAIVLLDSLRIDRAVLIGNSSPTEVMVYLAERYPHRVAGLVFLAGAPEPQLTGADDPLRIQEMGMRLIASVQGMEPESYVAQAENLTYRPEYLSTGASIALPALIFVGTAGDKGVEHLAEAWLSVAGQVSSGELPVPDSLARDYFTQLASDRGLQDRVREYYRTSVTHAWRESEEALRTAFGSNLRVVQLDTNLISGYEYRDAPELIYQHVRSFLQEISTPDSGR